jgi:hypothetical protein
MHDTSWIFAKIVPVSDRQRSSLKDKAQNYINDTNMLIEIITKLRTIIDSTPDSQDVHDRLKRLNELETALTNIGYSRSSPVG